MATQTNTRREAKAIRAARKLFPDVPKMELAGRLKKAAKLGRGRPPSDLAGLAPLVKVIDTTRSAGSLVRSM